MRRAILSAVLAWSVVSATGCFIPIYSGDPARRTRQLIFTSEDFRNVLDEWERIWHLNMPSHMTTRRTHGGII